MTIVDEFWNERIVGNTQWFDEEIDLLFYLQKRKDLYPEADSLLGLSLDRTGTSVLDYGSGPGLDLCGFMLNCNPKRLVGLDISAKALAHAKHNLNLLSFYNVELYKLSDSLAEGFPEIGGTFDFILSSGVLHHTSEPQRILLYLKSLMHNNSEMRIMVYNSMSTFNHLYVIAENDGVFESYVDGGHCPIARKYSSDEFISLCNGLGFDIEFLGGYPDPRERIDLLERIEEALQDNLPKATKEFLESVEVRDGLPYYNNKLCGLGGVYKLGLR